MTVQADPLAELRDIHLPAAIEFWPPAPGWWLLALMLVLGVFALTRFVYKNWDKKAYRREALRTLIRIRTEHGHDQSRFLKEFNELLKRVALTAFPRADVANLTGEAWVAFLDESGQTHEFSMGEGQVLIDGQYRTLSVVDVAALSALGERWIQQHQRREKPDHD